MNAGMHLDAYSPYGAGSVTDQIRSVFVYYQVLFLTKSIGKVMKNHGKN